ncbi:MAG: hypothetical protein IJE05_00905 [Clostridia bacterium]|nr:hypothetical protein [Clostridia bacterium]
MIQRLNKEKFRKKLIKRSFYEGVTFESKKLEKVISEWFFDLKEAKEVELNRFTELFCRWEEIVLPIRIKKESVTTLSIIATLIDAENKEYYMNINRRLHYDFERYCLGKDKDRNIIREFYSIIEAKNQVILESSYTSLLSEDSKNEDCRTTIHYDTKNSRATAKIQNKNNILEVVYHDKGSSMDEIVTEYLLSIKDKNYSKDIVAILKDFIAVVGKKEDIISIEARVKVEGEGAKLSPKEKVCARICIEDGEVYDYSPRKIII